MKNFRKKWHGAHLFSAVLVCLLIVTVGEQFIGLAEANFFPIQVPEPAFIISSEGNVEPSTAPIHRDGNVYTFTGNIVSYTVAVERDNVVLDGGGFSLQGNGNSTGIFVKNRNGVTVRNMNISGFTYAIRLFAEDFMSATSSGNTLSDNAVTNSEYGIYVSYSFNNLLRNNRLDDNKYNFWIKGGFISDTPRGYVNDVDSSNTVNGKPIIYWVNEQDKTVPSDAGYVALINCTNMKAQNLNLANNGQGILLVTSNNSQITQNHVTNCGSGIYSFNVSSIVIAENSLANNSDGIRAQVTSNSNISSNDITSNENGIYFTGSSENNSISGNTIIANTVDGMNLWGSRHTVVKENTITGNNETGINFFDSQNNEIIKNTITGNTGIGIKFWYDASENAISENQIANNSIGILIDDSCDNNITGNMITENNEWGIRFQGNQNNNIIVNNNFINNQKGEGLDVSITGVWTISGTKPGGGNVWDNGTTGNYWSDYLARYPNASQVDSSGVGNTPFFINENNIDRYPLMEPVIIPEFPTWTILPILAATMLLSVIHLKRKTDRVDS
jgi:parallel beta-helix repeat protein